MKGTWWKREPKRGTVMVGYPHGWSSMVDPFVGSLLRMVLYERSQPESQLYSKPGPVLKTNEILEAFGLLSQSGLYIGKNRTQIARSLLKSSADWLLTIDSDIEFPPDIIGKMLALAGDDKKILAASVPLGTTYPTSGFFRTEQPGVWRPVKTEALTGEPMEVDGLATAVMLIHREVFETIARRHGQVWFHHIYVPKRASVPVAGEDLSGLEFVEQGEDLAFCLRAAEAGYSSWCVKVPGLRHYKSLPLSHDFEKGSEAEEIEKATA